MDPTDTGHDGTEKVRDFGDQAPYGREAQPDEITPSYVFFASPLMSSYYSGEVLAPIGGETLPGEMGVHTRIRYEVEDAKSGSGHDSSL